MKLKNILIPSLTALSSGVALVATTTSCSSWIRYTDLLHKYQSWVRPLAAASVDQTSLERIYINNVIGNTNILRDDMLWSYSDLLTDPTQRGKISAFIDYTKFEFDVWPFSKKMYIRDGDIDRWETYYCLRFDVNVAGENKCTNPEETETYNEYLVDRRSGDKKSIQYFDFNFSTTIYGLNYIEFVSDVTYPVDGIKVMKINFDKGCIDMTTSGWYKTVGDEEQVYVNGEHDIITVASDVPLHYGWFGSTTLALFGYAGLQSNTNYTKAKPDPWFRFGSHYLKNLSLDIK